MTAPKPPMSPRQHYAAASNMLTRSIDRITAMYGGEPVPAHLMQHITDRATAHAILATVPQAQFDAWDAKEHSRDVIDTACSRCGRLLYRVEPNGHIEQPPPVREWEWTDGVATCSPADPDGCRHPHGSTRFREIGSEGSPCVHGRTPLRCELCHCTEQPRMTCGNCGTPCWSAFRQVDSRCDLTGCDGLMVQWPGPRP